MALIEIKVNREKGTVVSSRSIVRWINGALHVVFAVLLLFMGVVGLVDATSSQNLSIVYLFVGVLTLLYGVEIARGDRKALYSGIVIDVAVCAVYGYIYLSGFSEDALPVAMIRGLDLAALWYARPTFASHTTAD